MTGWALESRILPATLQDPAMDYCQWPYDPPAAPGPGAWQSSALLYQSFAVAGLSDRMLALCDALRAAVGPFRTVWGVKWAGDRLSWEFYFYDYARMQRSFDTAAFRRATDGLLHLTPPDADDHPYFMFSVEVDARHIDAGTPVDQIDLYIGNPGSAVSSGICYGLSRAGMEMRNFYFFFDAKAHFHDIREKIVSNAHVPLRRLRIEDILWPEMETAQTIVVANKRHNDGLYFSRIRAGLLVTFLDRLAFPAPIRAFVRENRARFDHLLFDVGYDYLPAPTGGVRLLKGSFYGLL
ncbi:MAG: hypothetical protein Q8K20_17585 [Gemmobacter sp.]|nr:hypothetical protein [Gemmobacter sp.]